MPPMPDNQENLFSTPMMKQYLEIKEKYPDCILFFRLGDFYEMFMDDAKLGASILDIALTSRDRGRDGRIPMCGVPFHAVDSYLLKFVKAGYKVAICEQIGDTSGPGLVERDVIRIVTPGTIFNENTLDKKENNFIMSVHSEGSSFGIAIADISTGFFETGEFPGTDFDTVVINELAKYHPTECVLPPFLYNDSRVLKLLKSSKGINIFPYIEWERSVKNPYQSLVDHFKIKSLESFGIQELPCSQKASIGLLAYLKYTQKGDLQHVKKISLINSNNHVGLDRSTLNNLEVFTTLRDGSRKGSLIDYLDKTYTPMGGRLLRQWLMAPLNNKEEIEMRYDAIDELLQKSDLCIEFKSELAALMDIERIISKLSVGIGGPRDVVNLKNSIRTTGALKDILTKLKSPLFVSLNKTISEEVLDLVGYISLYITDEPPIDAKTGGYIKNGIDPELDKLRKSIKGSKEYISDLEASERRRTGISSLKVKFNQVFGYYIEITKSNLSQVPKEYMRKQTMVNAERFITPELKEHEEIILTAEEKIKDLEYNIFLQVVGHILTKVDLIQRDAYAAAVLDCLLGFQELTILNNLSRPSLNLNNSLSIIDGRHPVVETSLNKGDFVPNDCYLNISPDENHDCIQQVLIITGPNMAGKSVYIRQTAVIVLMAHIGCFVPAKKADISLVDKIFVRSGASDFISGGLSTFMVEMMETANILNACTSKSLIIMDEIGRGTSTYDGISIAWAVAEYLVTNPDFKPKTLFATHYHELQELETKFPQSIANYQVLVEETSSGPVFLHKVVKGAAAHSYGIEVAKLAGVPLEVYKKALQVMDVLSVRASYTEAIPNQAQLMSKAAPLIQKNELSIFENKLKDLDISMTTPLEALNILAELKQIWDRNIFYE
jgi:DNA mismatch repair protein MutS